MKDLFAGFFYGFQAAIAFLMIATKLMGIAPPEIRERIYSEAIKAGAAIRVVDQETGETSIQWRTCDE